MTTNHDTTNESAAAVSEADIKSARITYETVLDDAWNEYDDARCAAGTIHNAERESAAAIYSADGNVDAYEDALSIARTTYELALDDCWDFYENARDIAHEVFSDIANKDEREAYDAAEVAEATAWSAACDIVDEIAAEYETQLKEHTMPTTRYITAKEIHDAVLREAEEAYDNTVDAARDTYNTSKNAAFDAHILARTTARDLLYARLSAADVALDAAEVAEATAQGKATH